MNKGIDIEQIKAMFDAQWYFSRYQDVALTGLDPWQHYLKYGSFLNRKFCANESENFPGILDNSEDGCLFNHVLLLYGNDGKLFENDFGDRLKAFKQYVQISGVNKFAVYTAIFGEFDKLREPTCVEDGVDYYCFTDSEEVKSEVFKVVRVSRLFDDPRLSARVVKILPELFLKNYDASMWVDGSTWIRGENVFKAIRDKMGDRLIAIHQHSQRNCIYQEASECIALKKDDKEKITNFCDFLKSVNYPAEAGLVESAQIVRRHVDIVHMFNRLWWSFVRDYTIRDQLSFNYISWALGVGYYVLDGSAWLDAHFKTYLHDHDDNFSCKDNPFIEIIVLVHNSLDKTRACVESVMEVTCYQNFSLRIVDNNSNEETKKYLEFAKNKYRNCFVSTNHANFSFSKANNDAVKSSGSEFVLFLNNDTVVADKHWLHRLINEMVNDISIGAVGPILLYDDFSVQSAGIDMHIKNGTVEVPAREWKKYRHSRFVDAISGACLLTRKKLHEKIGGFDERFFYGQEDIDYCLKIRELGFKVRLISSCEVMHLESSTRKFTSRTLANREILRLKWHNRVDKIPNNSDVSRPDSLTFKETIASKPISFKSFNDLSDEIRKYALLVPDQIDLIVGIPRSGMIPAYIIGAMKNLPVVSFDEFLNNIKPTKGDRKLCENRGDEDLVNCLFVDDSINLGNSLRRIKNKMKYTYCGKRVVSTFLAVYSSENWTSDEVLTLCRCENPRIFQWNYTNHSIANYSCYDLDGVLCIDPTDEQNDDGKMYLDFIENATPLYIPRYMIKTIVTSRLEKYRKTTVRWLEKHGVQYENLFMLNLPSKEKRISLNAHAIFKSYRYSKLKDTFLFYESDSRQADLIAKFSGKPVVCTENNRLYMPPKQVMPENDIIDYLIRLGILFVNTKEYFDAEECLRRAIEIQPSSSRALFHMSNLKALQNNFDKSIVFIDMAIQLDPSNHVYRVHRKNLEKSATTGIAGGMMMPPRRGL